MQINERQTKIIQAIRNKPEQANNRLASEFNVSVQTIRSDLSKLASAGLLERTHGGAVIPSGVRNIQYAQRRNLNRQVKSRIAQKVSQLIPNDASLFFNIGTTTEAAARALIHHKNLMVITNNLNVASILADHDSCELVITGGKFRQVDGGMIGDIAVDTVKKFKVDYAIIGTSALDSSGALLDFDSQEVRVAQTILEQARTSILVVDGSKFKHSAPVQISNMRNIDFVITDYMPESLVHEVQDNNTQVFFV